MRTPDSSDASGKHHHYPQEPDGGSNIDTIQKSPGEIQFFKLLHNQFQKAEHFFDRVIEGRVLNQRGTCPGRNANSQSK